MFILLFLSSPVLSHQRSFINIACCHVCAVVERISYTRNLPVAAWVAGSVEVIETEAILCHIRETNGICPKAGAAARGAGRAAGIPQKGGLPLDVSVPGEGGSTDHARRGAQAASDHIGTGWL